MELGFATGCFSTDMRFGRVSSATVCRFCAKMAFGPMLEPNACRASFRVRFIPKSAGIRPIMSVVKDDAQSQVLRNAGHNVKYPQFFLLICCSDVRKYHVSSLNLSSLHRQSPEQCSRCRVPK